MILMVGNTSRLETPMQNSTGNRERLLDVVGGFARFCGDSWTDAGSHLKRGVMLMWAAGISLVVLGVFGDVTKMWASFPFLTNLITSITAFFFAVPIALLFLQNITRRQAERLERATASRMLNDSMSRLALQRVRNTSRIWDLARYEDSPAVELWDLVVGYHEDLDHVTSCVNKVRFECEYLGSQVMLEFRRVRILWDLDEDVKTLDEAAKRLQAAQGVLERLSPICQVATAQQNLAIRLVVGAIYWYKDLGVRGNAGLLFRNARLRDEARRSLKEWEGALEEFNVALSGFLMRGRRLTESLIRDTGSASTSD